jgi:glucose/arabinose dehydrogenase
VLYDRSSTVKSSADEFLQGRKDRHRFTPSLAKLQAQPKRGFAVSGLITLVFVGLSVSSVSVGQAAIHSERPAPKGANGKVPVSGVTVPTAPFKVKLMPAFTAEQPIGVVTRPDDPALYVIEKQGKIRAWLGTAFAPTPVLDIVKLVDSVNERGLLGLAFHPTRGDVLYVDYVDKRGNVIVSELPFDGTTADYAKERRLLDMPKPFNEHNAGTIFFDAKGLLYVAIGDGGGSNDKFNNAQRTDVLLGKILRIDPTPSAEKPYQIPKTNPFTTTGLGATPRRGEIFAYGLRNPWRASLDQATGDLWIPDVGQARQEEINRMPGGQAGWNFGWKLREGLFGSKPKGAVDPVYSYPHADGRCAVVGGGIYRGKTIGALTGWYVFTDVCQGRIYALQPNGTNWSVVDLGERASYLTAFGTDNEGELWATSLEGQVYKMVAA